MTACFICDKQPVAFTDSKGRSYCYKHAPQDRTCPICNNSFTVLDPSSKRRFCSKNCLSQATKQAKTKNKNIKPAFDIGYCAICGKEFIKKTTNQRYCSSYCCQYSADIHNQRGRFLIFSRDGFRCFYCGKSSYQDGRELHVDHIVPRDAGGKDIASNLVTACVDCNLEKSKTRLYPDDEVAIMHEVIKRNKDHEISDDKIIKIGIAALDGAK